MPRGWAAEPSGTKLAQVMTRSPCGIAKHPVADWPLADFQFWQDYDAIISTTMLSRAGFNDVIDTEEMLLAHLAPRGRIRP